ncbi:MAG: hypothetical protein IKC87_03265 [Clostridia bacterium]|nr:hypothetical protein [Clostridia bacterium]
MKKTNFARISVLVLSIAILLVCAMAVTAMAADVSTAEFGSISVAYGDKVAIRVAVDATKEEIENGDITVSYTLNGETKNATYKETDENGTVWVMTEGIAAYDLAEVVSFDSYIGETQVESGRTYSVAQFLYRMLYTGKEISDEYRNLYEALLAYGEAAQIALDKNADALVTDSTIVFTKNAEVKLGTGSYVFAPAADAEIVPVWNGNIPLGSELCGWNIIDNGVEKAVELGFTASGVVEVVSPVYAELDPTPFILANGGFEYGLEGWTLVGNIGNVSADASYWTNENDGNGYAFGKDGEYMFSAYAPGASEGAVGTLTSSSFTVGGSGFVTFKLGAMKDGNYVYVDVVDAETKEILARYYNGLWADTTDGMKSGCTLVAYKADLSAFLGRNVFFRISDNADSGYGLFFADSFNTYYVTEPEGFNDATPVNYEVSGTIYDLFNGGFEYGDVQGWWNNGEPGKVTGADAFFSGVAYGKDGNFLYSGVEDHGAGNGREGNTGVLTSSVFELGGNGYITYMLGGGNALCYVQVIDAATGEILARYRQQARNDAVLVTYVADLTEYIGRTLRIQVVDKATSDWGCVSFDNVVTYYDTIPEGLSAIDVKGELVNGSFEDGNLNGWTMNITEAGAHNTVGWVADTEIDAEWYAKNDDTKDGNFLFTFARPGDVNCENTKGTLSSSTFVLNQNSYVAFKFGGAGGSVNHDVHVQLCLADGTVIATFYNDAEGKVNTRMNAYFYQYTAEAAECFFRVVDNSTGDYGCFVVDDFRVNLEEAPEGFIPAIQ